MEGESTGGSKHGVITPEWTQLDPHDGQMHMWRTKSRFVAAACGRGSGKTELARRYVVRHLPIKKAWNDPMYFYALPTVAQAKRIAWKRIKLLVPPNWLLKRPNESELKIETVFGATLYIIGMDKPHRIEGVQWDGGIVDESCDQKPGSFNLSIRPALSHRNGWCWRIGVPKRYGIGAAEFKEFWQRGMDGDPDIDSYQWPSEDILIAEECENAQRIMDSRDYNEQYRASWEQVGGSVFHAFDSVLNVREVIYDPNLPLIIGSDFNVDPMAWAIGQRHGSELWVLDELYQRNTNTVQCLDSLHRKYGGHTGAFDFFGDATGAARKSSASSSDYIQIRNDKRFQGARVFYPKANPRVKNRFAACNARFCNAAGERNCFIHPRCKNLIRDLETRAYKKDKKGVSEPDDYGDVGHITDALGYIIHRLWPIRVKADSYSPQISIS